MAVTNFLVSSLPAYVQTNRDLIIASFGLPNSGTRGRIGLQTGIKKDAYLNYLNLTAVFQDGSGCGFNPLDEIELGQKEISTAAIKVDGQICPETLLGKYAEYLVRIRATETELPFEQYILDTLIAQINKGIDFRFASQWFSITQDCARYVVSQEAWLEKVFRHTNTADEIFLPTLIWNSPFKEKLYDAREHPQNTELTQANMRFIDWTRGESIRHPWVFRADDWGLLMSVPHLWARKFDDSIDAQIIDRIYKTLSPHETALSD